MDKLSGYNQSLHSELKGMDIINKGSPSKVYTITFQKKSKLASQFFIYTSLSLQVTDACSWEVDILNSQEMVVQGPGPQCQTILWVRQRQRLSSIFHLKLSSKVIFHRMWSSAKGGLT